MDPATVDAPPGAPAPGEATLPGTLHLFGFPEFPARVRVALHDPGARIHRALKALGICWGLAVASVLVPIAHFVLVPGFVLTGGWLFGRRMGETATVLGASGHCPRCDAAREFRADGPLKEHAKAQCPVCHNQFALTISRAESP